MASRIYCLRAPYLKGQKALVSSSDSGARRHAVQVLVVETAALGPSVCSAVPVNLGPKTLTYLKPAGAQQVRGVNTEAVLGPSPFKLLNFNPDSSEARRCAAGAGGWRRRRAWELELVRHHVLLFQP